MVSLQFSSVTRTGVDIPNGVREVCYGGVREVCSDVCGESGTCDMMFVGRGRCAMMFVESGRCAMMCVE